MSSLSPPKKICIFLVLVLAVTLSGCTHQKTLRGHLLRGDWAIEYNRTPWIGCPPDSGCPDDEDSESGGLFSCLKKDDEKMKKGFRRHCAMNAECTPKNPCSRTLGCGMWVTPSDSSTVASLGGAAKACGITPFCSPQKPCNLTPHCGKPVNVNVNAQTMMLASQNGSAGSLGGMYGGNAATGAASGNIALSNGIANGGVGGGTGNGMSGGMGMATIRGMNPMTMNPATVNSMAMAPNGAMIPNGTVAGRAVGAIPGSLVSRGIVPGASTITTGGMVAAIGVATPAGTMTPTGVRMPNGVINNAIVLRSCVMTPNCTAAHPCGLTPICGSAVAVNMVTNNAVALASALQAQGVASGVMQTGGMGMMVNPMTNQPINGLTMGGYPQAGYPPIGYAPSGHAPGYPRFAAGMIPGMIQGGEMDEMHEEVEYPVLPETRSQMPVPRFQTIPVNPAFQRSEGMPPTPKAQRTVATPTTTAMIDREYESALDQAYLEGVSAAMDEVERKLEEKRQLAARAKLQEKILHQSESVQQQLDQQEYLRMLALQRERQARQQQAEALAASEPRRLPPPKAAQSPMVAVRANNSPPPNPLQMAENLKSSVVSGVNGALAPLLASNQPASKPAQSKPAPSKAQSPATSKVESEVAIVPPSLPGRPPVMSGLQNYGLLSDDESDAVIMQAQFTADNVSIMP
jgi:hypothetical protein